MSLQAWDVAIGAAAGVSSVLISMPFDVIKTYMQTHGAEAAATGAAGQIAAFVATGETQWLVCNTPAIFIDYSIRAMESMRQGAHTVSRLVQVASGCALGAGHAGQSCSPGHATTTATAVGFADFGWDQL